MGIIYFFITTLAVISLTRLYLGHDEDARKPKQMPARRALALATLALALSLF